MMHGKSKLALVLGALFLAPIIGGVTPAGAATATNNVQVTTSVTASCNIYAGTIAFAPYDPINTHQTNPNDQTGTFVIRCTRGATGLTVDLGAGLNASGNQRRMVHATNPAVFLNYGIYKETGRTIIWGTGAGGTPRDGADLDGTGADVTVTMYGQIPPAQTSAISGNYNDTVVSTINF